MISARSDVWRTGKLARLVVLPLAIFAAAFVLIGARPGGPSRITLEMGNVFAQEIVDFLKMDVHTITLAEPESEWGMLAAGLKEYQLQIDMTVEMLPFGGGKFGLVQATLGGAEMEMEFRGRRFGSLSTEPCQLGGGGKRRTLLTGMLQVSPWEAEAFREIADEVVHGDEFSVELWSVLSIQLRGDENGCPLGDAYCSTVGSFTIPLVKFAKSLQLRGAKGLGLTLSNMDLTDLPAQQLAGATLISIDAVIENNSSFQMLNLDEMHMDIYTDLLSANLTEALGHRIAQVNTEHGFSLLSGVNPPVPISGQLHLPDREQDMISLSKVFNAFLSGRPTPLLAKVVRSSQPFFTVAAEGKVVRCLLPGIGDNLRVGFANETTGLGQIIEVVHIDFNIPVALATLANPLNGLHLNQFVQLELKNPIGATVKVTGLTVELHYDGADLGGVDLPRLTEEQHIVLPPHAHIRTSVWLPVNVDISPSNVIPLTKLLHTMAREEAYSKGLGPQAPPALVTIEATLKVMVGGVAPIIEYTQGDMPVII